jgi:aryl-alcohol dehydrogenase-like predicted oxidoreductase
LEENINAFDVELSDEVKEEILAVIKNYPAPF